MTVSKHQFHLLSEMGIALWQRRIVEPDPQPLAQQQDDTITNLDFTVLKSHPLFQDILLSLELSLGEVSPHNDHLSLGLLRWQFSASKQLKLSGKVLTTPELQVLAASGTLKRQLWQLLQEHSL